MLKVAFGCNAGVTCDGYAAGLAQVGLGAGVGAECGLVCAGSALAGSGQNQFAAAVDTQLAGFDAGTGQVDVAVAQCKADADAAL